jgi:hypothetical protein
MNPASYKLSKEVLQEMLEDEYNKKFHKFETIYDRQVQGQSPADLSQKWMDDFFVRISEPLKKMQAEYLTQSAKTCFKEKHIQDANTNLEQVLLCRENERAKVFDKFDQLLTNHRDSSRFKFQDCIFEANNNVEEAVYCVRGYIQNIKDDNDNMVASFNKDYAKYL